MEEAGDIRLHAHRLGIHTHKQVVHGGVGTDGQPQNAAGGNPGAGAKIGNNGGEGFFDDGILELLPATGLALLDDAVDDIGTVANLAVAGGAFGENLAAFQIRQHHGDGGGANVDGAAHQHRVGGGGDFHAAEAAVL